MYSQKALEDVDKELSCDYLNESLKKAQDKLEEVFDEKTKADKKNQPRTQMLDRVNWDL